MGPKRRKSSKPRHVSELANKYLAPHLKNHFKRVKVERPTEDYSFLVTPLNYKEHVAIEDMKEKGGKGLVAARDITISKPVALIYSGSQHPGKGKGDYVATSRSLDEEGGMGSWCYVNPNLSAPPEDRLGSLVNEPSTGQTANCLLIHLEFHDEKHNPNKRMISLVVSVCDVKRGDELTMCYGSEYQDRTYDVGNECPNTTFPTVQLSLAQLVALVKHTDSETLAFYSSASASASAAAK